MIEAAKRRRGRPANPESKLRGENLTIRIRPELKQALERSADEHQRSLSAEVESRLGITVESDNLLDQVLDLAFGRQGAALLLMLGFVMRDAGAHAGFMKTHTLAGASGWPDVPYAFDMAKQAVDTVFEALYPEGEREAPWGGKISSGPDFGELNKVLGNGFATGLLNAVAGDERTPEQEHLAQKIRDRLSPAAIERIKEWVEGSDHG